MLIVLTVLAVIVPWYPISVMSPTGNDERSVCRRRTGSHHVCPYKWTTQTHAVLVGYLTRPKYFIKLVLLRSLFCITAQFPAEHAMVFNPLKEAGA